MEPKHGGLEDEFPFQLVDFLGSMLMLSCVHFFIPLKPTKMLSLQGGEIPRFWKHCLEGTGFVWILLIYYIGLRFNLRELEKSTEDSGFGSKILQQARKKHFMKMGDNPTVESEGFKGILY